MTFVSVVLDEIHGTDILFVRTDKRHGNVSTQNGIITLESELKLTSPGMMRKLVASLKRALLDSKRYGLQRLFPARLPPPNISPKWTLNEASSVSMLAFRYGMILKAPHVRKGRNVSE